MESWKLMKRRERTNQAESNLMQWCIYKWKKTFNDIINDLFEFLSNKVNKK